MNYEDKPWESEPEHVDFEAHGLPCRLRRGPFGHWCGYVGVDSSHPWHGIDYSTTVAASRELLEAKCSDFPECVKAGAAGIDLMMKVHGGLTYSGWKSPGDEPDGRWWFGFDCAHHMDYAPQMAGKMPRLYADAVYRDVEYVKAEAERLAEQLAHIGRTETKHTASEEPTA